MPRLKFVSKVEGADTIELQEPIITIGRGINNVVCIEDANISKHHVLLIAEDDTYRIFDLHSINGTSVNGKRISTATLRTGDAVRIGYLDLSYEITPAVTAAPVAPAPPVVPVVAEPTPPPPAPPAPIASAPVTPKAPEPAAPVVAPAPKTPTEPIAAAPAKRSLFGFGKRAPAPAPTPAPVTPPAPEPVAPVVAAPTPPTPAPTPVPAPVASVVAAPTPVPAPAAPEPPAAPAEEAPTNAPPKKKFGAPPGGQNVKFKLKRE